MDTKVIVPTSSASPLFWLPGLSRGPTARLRPPQPAPPPLHQRGQSAGRRRHRRHPQPLHPLSQQHGRCRRRCGGQSAPGPPCQGEGPSPCVRPLWSAAWQLALPLPGLGVRLCTLWSTPCLECNIKMVYIYIYINIYNIYLLYILYLIYIHILYIFIVGCCLGKVFTVVSWKGEAVSGALVY